MKKKIKILLNKYWGYDSFRPMQYKIIESVIQKKDTLALLPTGAGKSICYQLPAIAQEGVCIVISPLIALMQDQVEGLKKRKIKSCYINSSMSRREIDISLDNCIYGNIKLLYVSPERLKTEIFIERFKKMNVSFVAVDEAHCISQWGYDFRPSYLNIASLKEIKPELCFIALTATATPKVALDIQHHLQFNEQNIIKNSFYRKNLSYQVVRSEDKLIQLTELLNKNNQSALIYVNTRRKCHEIANHINRKEKNALIYHAGLSNKDRSKIQEQWIRNEFRTIVATNAFGMGIDKPDVRTVVNFDLPNSIEAYFQEAGRAGRNGEKAYSILMINENDKIELKKRILMNYPSIELIQLIYQKFCNLHQIAIGYGEETEYLLKYDEFSDFSKLNVTEIYHAFRILELSEHIKISNSNVHSSKVQFLIFQNQLSDFIYRNTKYSSLIKLILRSYSGLFDHETQINEVTIAKRLTTDPEIIKKLLKQLDELKVISYKAKNEGTYITFLEPRKDVKHLHIPAIAYHQRKSNDLNKMEAVIKYAYNNEFCRNKLLLKYFGEDYQPENCLCDVCIDRYKDDLSNNPNEIATFIKSKLKQEPMDLNQIIGKNRSSKQQKQFTDVIKKMLDSNEVRMNDLNQIQLNQK